jgi:hypothetical protein
MGIEDGAQLRVDPTVVATNIQFPTDSKLLWDCVRVLTRLVERLVKPLPRRSGQFTTGPDLHAGACRNSSA